MDHLEDSSEVSSEVSSCTDTGVTVRVLAESLLLELDNETSTISAIAHSNVSTEY